MRHSALKIRRLLPLQTSSLVGSSLVLVHRWSCIPTKEQTSKVTLMHQVCDVMGISKTRTTAYHPRCDGQVERQNKTLQDMLAAFVSNRQDDFDLWLDPMVFAYNSSCQESLGISPYEVLFGKTPKMPLELELGIPVSNPATHSEYVRSLREVLKDIRNIANTHLSKASEKQTRENKPRPEWKPFLPGQAVWLQRPKTWKLCRKWVGPYSIVSRLGVNYKIRSKDGKEFVTHHDSLRLSSIPVDEGMMVCPTRETGDFRVVRAASHAAEMPVPEREGPAAPRVRPAGLRPIVRAPVWRRDYVDT